MTALELLTNGLIVAVCAASAAGCFLVNRRIRRLESTEIGIGKAIAELSRSLARLQEALAAAEGAALDASARLEARIGQAKVLAERLETAGVAGRTGRPASSQARGAGEDADPLADIVPRGLARDDQAEPADRPPRQAQAAPDGHALARLVLAARAASRRRPGTSSGGQAAA
jgi:hypothetical protein